MELYEETPEKPIIVFGAGQSTQTFLTKHKIEAKDFYILCVDTALQPLLKNGIKPDGVFIEEAQSVISKAFIGLPENITVFSALTSLPNLVHKSKLKSVSYFFTEYTQAAFLDRLKKENFMPEENKPYGSVGLTAVYYALKFRKDSSIPVYVTGLDFSFSPGITHTKGALAHILQLIKSNRINNLGNYSSAYGSGSEKILDKNGHNFITTPVLKNYAAMFNAFFEKEEALFDAGESGLSLSIPKKSPQSIKAPVKELKKDISFSQNEEREIQAYLCEERKALEYLKSLLTGKTKLEGKKLLEEIKKTAEPREYLYLHFPDGWHFSTDQSFLNRIRTEIDFFLKYL